MKEGLQTPGVRNLPCVSTNAKEQLLIQLSSNPHGKPETKSSFRMPKIKDMAGLRKTYGILHISQQFSWVKLAFFVASVKFCGP